MSASPAQMARHQAYERLRELYPEQWDDLYDQARVARGLKPVQPRKAERIASLKAQLARLEGSRG